MKSIDTTLARLAEQLGSGAISSRSLVEECLEKILDREGEGVRIFLEISACNARKTADAMDALRACDAAPSPYAGIPVSIKDLFDIQGQVTRAGSTVLNGQPAANRDAAAVARLRQAGFVIIGRTNMTEFAYSGLGLNPHYGTPINSWKPDEKRAPGGSSSGAALSIACGMAYGALGSDTGGSCRIPAAFTGTVGFKPSANKISSEGMLPLAPSLDTVGPIARTVDCCERLFRILAVQGIPGPSRPKRLQRLTLGVPQSLVLEQLDPAVANDFERTISRLASVGIRIVESPFLAFENVSAMNASGGFPAIESYAWHQELLTASGQGYDPRVKSRILRGATSRAADYLDLVASRREFVRCVNDEMAGFDALVYPTVAIIPPRLGDLESERSYDQANQLALRNAGLVNLWNGCAISIPMNETGQAPTGLMVAGSFGQDEQLLSIGRFIEEVLSPA